jgi:hypothetical protein
MAAFGESLPASSNSLIFLVCRGAPRRGARKEVRTSEGDEKVSKVEIPEIPPEIALQQLLVLLVTYIDGFMHALTDKFGSEKALRSIRPYELERWKDMARIAPMLGIEGKDAIAFEA